MHGFDCSCLLHITMPDDSQMGCPFHSSREWRMHAHTIQGRCHSPNEGGNASPFHSRKYGGAPISLKKGCHEMLYNLMLYISTSSTPQHITMPDDSQMGCPFHSSREWRMHAHTIQGRCHSPNEGGNASPFHSRRYGGAPISLKKGCHEMLYKIMLYISTSSTPQH